MARLTLRTPRPPPAASCAWLGHTAPKAPRCHCLARQARGRGQRAWSATRNAYQPTLGTLVRPEAALRRLAAQTRSILAPARTQPRRACHALLTRQPTVCLGARILQIVCANLTSTTQPRTLARLAVVRVRPAPTAVSRAVLSRHFPSRVATFVFMRVRSMFAAARMPRPTAPKAQSAPRAPQAVEAPFISPRSCRSTGLTSIALAR